MTALCDAAAALRVLRAHTARCAGQGCVRAPDTVWRGHAAAGSRRSRAVVLRCVAPTHDCAAWQPVDVVVSCLASRTGGIKDSWAVDYQATKNAMDAGRESGASHFVLLSAICVQ